MKVSIKPINCRQCPCCYEAKIGDQEWDMKKVMKTLTLITKSNKASGKLGGSNDSFTIHGGEPLLLPLKDLTRLLRYSHQQYGRSGIQTNLLHYTEKHLALFKKFNTSVGVSLDGHTFHMNVARGYSDPQLSKVLAAIEELAKEKISTTVIAVLWSWNTSCISELLDFVYYMETRGIKFVRFNRGFVHDKDLLVNQCDNERLYETYRNLFGHMMSGGIGKTGEKKRDQITINPIREMIDGMMGKTEQMTCAFKECDPWTSTAEITLMGNGELGSCLHGAASLDGLQIPRGGTPSLERYEMLRKLPQEHNGCKDCEFWYMCHGGCPGAGENNDWRNRTRFCEAYKKTFAMIYGHLKATFPNVHLTPDFYPDPPRAKEIDNSIKRSTYQAQHRKTIKKTEKTEFKHIRKNGKKYDDSDSEEWLKKNPDWTKRR